MDGEQVKIVDLGQIVSDIRQEQNNIDLKLRNGRGTLFKLLGPAFAYKYLLSPPVKRLSVLSSTFPLNERISEPMCIFQRKVLGSILKLSKTAANCILQHLGKSRNKNIPNCEIFDGEFL